MAAPKMSESGKKIVGKDHSDEISDRNEKHILDNGRKSSLLQWQRTWLNYVYVLVFLEGRTC